ncbi:metalloregulator ArsR/SmtB family transcription factor [Planktotalea sp.]|uniref:ArsR/SmtB family transcription factor n=1 Tax=Planktotalea sp. TaxID=2029877 RepID=UPI003297E069
MPYEDQFAALAHPLRQHIITSLQSGACTVGDLTQTSGASQPVVSQHLKVLRDAGLIIVEPQGTKRFYRIEPQSLDDLRNFLTEHWQNALNGLAQKDD